jgi:LEA14-like dessication related protein
MRALVRSLAVLAAVVVLGCGGHAKKKLPAAPIPVERPLVALQAAHVESLGFSGLELVFDCRIENPNPFPLSVVKVSYALALEGRAAAKGSNATPIVIEAGALGAPGAPVVPGRGAVVVPVSVRFADVPAFAPLLVRDRDAAYALTGEVTFHTPAGDVRVPLSQTGRLGMPRAPKIRVANVRLAKASPREVALELSVAVENPNAFPIPAGRIHYALFLSGKEVARTDLVVADPIAGGASAAFPGSIKVSVLKAGTAAARLLIPFTSLDASVRGEAVFGGVPVPLDVATSILPRK